MKSCKKRFGIILINKETGYCYVVRRINYLLWNIINNVHVDQKNINWKSMLFAMYPGVDVFLEFPKGVKECRETGFDCAVREFYEETKICFSKESTEILGEILQKIVGGNGKTYSVKYYVINDCNIQADRDTVVKNIDNPLVVGDSFNVLILTKWDFIRDFFVTSDLLDIVYVLDKIFNF